MRHGPSNEPVFHRRHQRVLYSARRIHLRGGAFLHAKAVSVEERGNEVIITPIRALRAEEEHLPIAQYSMRDWLDAENDDLFSLPDGA